MLNADVTEGRTLLISGANSKINDQGEYANREVVKSLKALINNLTEKIK